jgi:hypothetical protein
LDRFKAYRYTHKGSFSFVDNATAGYIVATQSLLMFLQGTRHFQPTWCGAGMAEENKCTTEVPYIGARTSTHRTALSSLVAIVANKVCTDMVTAADTFYFSGVGGITTVESGGPVHRPGRSTPGARNHSAAALL